MKTYCLLLIVLTLVCVNLYGVVTEDFENCDLSSWEMGSNKPWMIHNDKGNKVLWHGFDNNDAGNDQVSLFLNTLSLDSTATWEFSLRHGYNPSSSNLWAVFLLADNNYSEMRPGGKINGYALGVNIKKNDDLLTFYRLDNGAFNPLLTTAFNWQEVAGTETFTRIRVFYNEDREWEIYVDTSNTSANFKYIGSMADTLHSQGYYFGIYYKYTAAQDMKLHFDDLMIRARIQVDTTRPYITAFEVLSDTSLYIICNEPVRFQADTAVITLDGMAAVVERNNPATILCRFDKTFGPNNQVAISGITDMAGNRMNDTIIWFSYYIPQIYDIIISEVMPGPMPSMGLPGAEYVELYNRVPYETRLNNWQLCVNERCRTILNTSIDGNAFLVLCHTNDTSKFQGIAKVAGVDRMYVMPDQGARLTLLDQKGNIMHTLLYSPSMHTTAYKQDGGWSLEMIDPDNACVENKNWGSSIHISGGSPGAANSISGSIPYVAQSYLQRVSVVSDNTLKVHFPEKINHLQLLNRNNYYVERFGNPYEVSFIWPDYSVAELRFRNSFSKGIMYNLVVTNSLTDCAGHAISRNTARFTLPDYPAPNDLVVNEILFEPGVLGTEFIEIYNRGIKTIDLDDIRLALREDYTGKLKNIVEVEEKGYLLFPGEYLALTNNIENLKEQYQVLNPDRVHKNMLPHLPNQEATLVICDKGYETIDMVRYNINWHHRHLANTKGVSLERVNPDMPSSNRENWHSASTISGYATPGYLNSQYQGIEATEKEMALWPEIFSPDNDGFDDVLFISLACEESGAMGHIKVYNAKGHLVRYLANNQLLGTDNLFIWDGTNDKGSLSPYGIYMVYIRLHTLTGVIKEYKKTCVLGGRFK